MRHNREIQYAVSNNVWAQLVLIVLASLVYLLDMASLQPGYRRRRPGTTVRRR